MAVRGIYPLWAEDGPRRRAPGGGVLGRWLPLCSMGFGPIEKLIDTKRGIKISNLLLANLDRRTELGRENLIGFLNIPLLV